MRVFLIVIDSFGIGEMPDAADYGDVGSDTYGHIYEQTGAELNELVSLGLNNIEGVAKAFGNGKHLDPVRSPRAAYARLAEKSPAKDTTAGHFEIAGLIMRHPYRTYKKFPPDIVAEVEHAAGVKFIGNEVASGTEIIQRLGEVHLKTGEPILYTSADSVMQIAADTSVIPLSKLYDICKIARRIMTGDRAVGRIIARPFIHKDGKFTRTEDRKDFSLEPPGKTMLDVLSEADIPVIAVGKINDIFCGRGITRSIHTGDNAEGLEVTKRLAAEAEKGLIFVNLVDTDMLYGHRNNVLGYAQALKEIDEKLDIVYKNLQSDDLLLITADHGCDPTTPSTDHSREYVPLLILGEKIGPKNLGTVRGFDCIADLIAVRYGLQKNSELYQKLSGGAK